MLHSATVPWQVLHYQKAAGSAPRELAQTADHNLAMLVTMRPTASRLGERRHRALIEPRSQPMARSLLRSKWNSLAYGDRYTMLAADKRLFERKWLAQQ